MRDLAVIEAMEEKPFSEADIIPPQLMSDRELRSSRYRKVQVREYTIHHDQLFHFAGVDD